jgi:DNA polymerase-3 subunit delta
MFYLFHGEDTHSKKETLARLLNKLGDPAMLDLNTTRFTGVMPLATLRQACDALPFLAPARIVIVTDLFAAKPGKEFLAELLAYLSQLPDTTRLVFLESKTLPDNNKFLQLAREAKNGYQKLFDPLRGGELEHWIQDRTEEKNGRISRQAAHLLAVNVGNDLHILDNELEKLVAYKSTDEAATIESADVAKLSPYVAEASIFDLVDALGNRNGKRASLLLQQKLHEGTEPFYLFSMFIRQFRLLIQVKELAEAGYRPQGISREIKQHSFVVGKLYQQARGFSLQELEQIYCHMLEIDIAVKTGQADMLTSLDLLVANLTITA